MGHHLEAVLQDLRYGMRMLFKNPGFTSIAILTLALGIGANTVIFSLINTALLRSLPFRDPSRLVVINNTHPEIAGNVGVGMSYLNYQDLKEQSASFQDMAVYSPSYGEKTLLHNGEPDVVNCTLVSHNLFSLMGVRPQYGRDFLPQEDQSGQDRVAVLSHRLWVRRFGSDLGVVGKNIQIREGRGFQDSDTAENAPHRLIINETMARTYFRNESPIGKKIFIPDAPKREEWTIVGVVADVKDLGVDRDPQPEIYSPTYDNNILLAHTTVDPLSLTHAIRQVVKSIDPSQPVGQARAMREVLDESLSRRKFPVDLMSLFSALALILSAIGIYSVMSYSVVQRRSEIGIRMALGAGRANIISLLLKQVMTPVAVGLAMGLHGAWLLKRVLSELLYGVSSTDFVTYVIVIILIVLTAVIATLLPSHRATEIDPLTALRQE